MNSATSPKKPKFMTWFHVIVLCLAASVLALAFSFLWLQGTWVKPELRDQHDAFFFGTIGTEIMPQAAFEALPELFPENFQPLGVEAGDWVKQFGFIRLPENANEGFPVGIALSNYRAKSAAPSPTKFVGFSCALCHTSVLKTLEGEGSLVVGNSNTSLNLFAWIDALQASLLDEKRLTVDAIAAVYERKHSQPMPLGDRIMTRVWLTGARRNLKANLPKDGDPYGGQGSMSPDNVPTGPARTVPFRTLVRNLFNRPARDMAAYSKLATIYEQNLQEWAQFDGTVRDLLARSSMAAFAAGATVENMKNPEIARNIIQASDYTRTLKGPSFAEVFPGSAAALDQDRIHRGEKLFDTYCFSCHGRPDKATGEWLKGSRQGEVIPVEDIGTDPARVNFRYYNELPDRLYKLFPEDHPFAVSRADLRPGPAGNTRGYLNKPLTSIFTRAPYLHNASILTLAELINLKPRQDVFFRGRNVYDTENVGLLSPEAPNSEVYFRFDTSLLGNSNKGHDYPWTYQGEGWNESKLKDLLEYLKTL
jgi:hypothetical protein